MLALLRQLRPTSSNVAAASNQFAAARGFVSTPVRHGLEEFFEVPDKDGNLPPSGRGWRASELRGKSWDDLHKLWYVLLKERNMLHSEKLRYRAASQTLPNPFRLTKVRRSMARIKHVLNERALAEVDPQKRRDLKLFIDTI